MSQLSDADADGFDPYAYARRKRAAAADRELTQASGEADIIAGLTDRIAQVIADAEVEPGTWQVLVDCAAVHSLTMYRERATTVLAVLAPLIAERDAALARLRDHLLAEADRLGRNANRTLTAGTIAGTLRGIVETTR